VLESLTHGSFETLLGQRFELSSEPASSCLELICAEPLDSRGKAPGARQPFHLIFRGPRELVLAQRIYALTHSAFGVLEIFLVPIGPDQSGQCYEAVFA